MLCEVEVSHGLGMPKTGLNPCYSGICSVSNVNAAHDFIKGS